MKSFYLWLMSLDRSLKILIQITVDIFMIYTCFITAMVFRLESFSFFVSQKPLYAVSVTIPITVLTFYSLGLYNAVVRYISPGIVWILFKGVLISSLMLLVLSQIFELQVPRSVPIIYFFILIGMLAITRYCARKILGFAYTTNFQRKKVAIYGAGHSGRQLLEALRASPQYLPITFIDDDTSFHKTTIGNVPVTSLEEFSKKYYFGEIDSILIAMPSISQKMKKEIVKKLNHSPFEITFFLEIAVFLNILKS